MIDERDGFDGNLKFRYNREKRLENAPDIVRDIYRRGYTPNKGFIKGLTANAGLRSVFFAIMLLSAVIIGVSVFDSSPDTAHLSGVKVSLRAFLYGDSVFVSASFDPVGAYDEEDTPVMVRFEGLDSSGEVISVQVGTGIFTGDSLNVRGALRDYELTTVRARVEYGESEAELTASVDRN